MPDARVLNGHRGRLVPFLLSALVVFAAMYVLYSAIDTLRQLEVIESRRDQWQRSAEVLQALDLRPGNVVADLGSGAGYFALKLSPIVGKQGQVLAVDIRKLSLSFLWISALQSQKRNLGVVLGDEDDPRLPSGAVDAVLIASTFHAFKRQNLTWKQQIGGATPIEAQKAARHASLDMTYLYTRSDKERETRQQQAMFDYILGDATTETKQ
jgi:SAM-dependent methyltransferase